MSLCRTWRDFRGFWEPGLGLVEKSSPEHKWWPGCWKTHSRTPGDAAWSSQSQRAPPGWDLPVNAPGDSHHAHSAALPCKAAVGPQTAHSHSLSGPSFVHQLLLRLERAFDPCGPQCFHCTRSGQRSPARGARGKEEAVEQAFYTPSAWGCSPTGLPPILYNPEASSACAWRTCVCASECELSEKHAFWHKTCDITQSIRSEASRLPSVIALPPRKATVPLC